jgi:hypothetical protein
LNLNTHSPIMYNCNSNHELQTQQWFIHQFQVRFNLLRHCHSVTTGTEAGAPEQSGKSWHCELEATGLCFVASINCGATNEEPRSPSDHPMTNLRAAAFPKILYPSHRLNCQSQRAAAQPIKCSRCSNILLRKILLQKKLCNRLLLYLVYPITVLRTWPDYCDGWLRKAAVQ